MTRTYEFTVLLQGQGNNEEEAWEDAINAFGLDPGDFSSIARMDTAEVVDDE